MGRGVNGFPDRPVVFGSGRRKLQQFVLWAGKGGLLIRNWELSGRYAASTPCSSELFRQLDFRRLKDGIVDFTFDTRKEQVSSA